MTRIRETRERERAAWILGDCRYGLEDLSPIAGFLDDQVLPGMMTSWCEDEGCRDVLLCEDISLSYFGIGHYKLQVCCSGALLSLFRIWSGPYEFLVFERDEAS